MTQRQLNALQFLVAALCVVMAVLAILGAYRGEVSTDRAVPVIAAALALAAVIFPGRLVRTKREV